MIRLVALGALVACVLGAMVTDAQEPTFRGGADVVRVFVTVLDKDGRLVTTLARDDFEIRDAGKPQAITQFDNRPQPIRLIVLLDVSGSMEGNLQLLQGAGAQLFARLLRDDVAKVGAFGHDVTISPTFTHDAKTLEAAMPDSIAPDAPTPLWRAIDQAMSAFEAGEGRDVILVLSDGKDSGPISFRERPMSQGDVIDRARRQDVMIYGVGMRSRSRQGMPPGRIGPGGLQAMLMADMPDPGLARVAEETGGGYTEIRFGQDLGAALAAVADELHSQYLLGYAPPKRDGKLHDINVKVAAAGLKARARKSYLAPKE